jgi:hypothetical protein
MHGPIHERQFIYPYVFKNINYIILYQIIAYFRITLTHLCYDDSDGALVDRNAPAML